MQLGALQLLRISNPHRPDMGSSFSGCLGRPCFFDSRRDILRVSCSYWYFSRFLFWRSESTVSYTPAIRHESSVDSFKGTKERDKSLDLWIRESSFLLGVVFHAG